MVVHPTDATRPSDLTGHGNGTGPVCSQYPVYRDLLPPCNNACPAGQNIQAWLSLAQSGQYKAAWQVLMQDNPLPAVLGRVCYHPCEDHCNRAFTDSSVGIHLVERYLGDRALAEGWKPANDSPPTGRKVLIVGAGPSGLSAAYHLRRLGHTVEVREAGPLPGGMMHFGIPAYRLPRKELEQEVRRIVDMGVKIVYNHKVEDIAAERREGGFDAVFIAIGAHLSQKVDIPSRDAGKILDALSFLKEVEKGAVPRLGRKVAVYGGGNTAMDVARTVQRLKGHEALVIYRRDMEHMPAHEFEVREALEEGVKINWLRSIKEVGDKEFTVEVMRLENGRPVPTGEFETLEADTLILALGQNADSGFLRLLPGVTFKKDGTVEVGPDMMTGCPGVFAGGDMVPCERTVAVAIGHGKKAARYINAYLEGVDYVPAAKHPVIESERLHIWFRTHAPQREQAELPLAGRLEGFGEVKEGLTEAEARFEAGRCFSCGNCYECDGCFGSCPEKAIIKLGKGKRYEINYDACTGCGVCYEQCPCHAIDMVPEAFTINSTR